MLSTELCGIKLENPLLLAAGILGTTAASMNNVLNSGAAGVVTKSFSKEPNKGYKNPTIAEVEGGIINAVGLSSSGVDLFKDELALINRDVSKDDNNDEPEINKPPKIAIASIYGSTVDEFIHVSSKIENLIDMIELNISCPHAMAGYGSAIGQCPDNTFKVVNAVKNSVSVPVLTKLTPNVTDISEIAFSAQKAGSDGITLINSLGPGMKIDINAGVPILKNKFGGLSGPVIKPIAIKHVYDLYDKLDIPIVGVGGIKTCDDVVEFLYAGSSAIQIGTSIMCEGLEIFSKINYNLIKFMKEKGFKSIDEMIGYAH
ncbi:MAG: dihydroorotate dehydrogenase [Methanobrevibacter sp.]|jgi:dihydroorotate dehydrogenase (NAD+) catalytic subunit|nr:dihydroorotate dehydrogenase [Candidatus Methanovirga meridionalis]